ncbi:MAG: electron transport complex subunit RsxC, partial [Clostridia bacterium]|nr:electron transport complex subunit RsxC [Clostridia bacterium]
GRRAGVVVDTLVINGAECEPYITADHRIMLEHTDEVILGVKILMKVLNVQRCLIGIENNKMNAIKAMKKSAKAISTEENKILVKALQVKYPQGAEKQLIYSLTGRKVPSGGLPAAVGCVVQNISTAYATYQAVVEGRPLTERVVTVSGKGIARPANLLVKVGTRISDIVDYLGGLKEDVRKIVLGGPMMGFAISDLSIPVTKTTSAILFMTDEEINNDPISSCIRCGWCLEACPQGLEPKEIAIYVEANRAEETAQFGLFDCVECGSCAYVCPAKRPLVQFIRIAKSKAKRP